MKTYPKVLLLASMLLLNCNSNGDYLIPEEVTVQELPAVFQNFASNVNIYSGGDYVVIETDDIPNHSSPYFAQSDARYEVYNGNNSNFRINPNRISAQSITLKIPVNPTEAISKQSTPLSAIGVSVNRVVFFNQYVGPNEQPLTNEINSFD